jgi:hypothetical protein
MMTPSIPFLIVTSLYEVFIEGMEYNDTFHTFSHCDLTDRSIYSIPSIKTSVTEVTMSRGVKCVIVLHPLNKYVIQWGHNKKRCERCHLWSIYWMDGVWWHLPYLFSLWPHCMKYLLRGRSTMTPFIPVLIETSLYDVFVEGIKHERSQWEKVWKVSSYSIPSIDTSYNEVKMRKGVEGVFVLHPFNTTVWSIYWEDGVRWHLSYLCSLRPHCMMYLLRGLSMMTPFTPFLIVTKYFSQRGQYKQRYERYHRTPSSQ